MPLAAAQVIVTIIPIVGIVMGAVVAFFYFYWNYKQKMAMIERNMLKQVKFDLDLFSLFAGLLLSFIGMTLMIFFFIKEGFSYGSLGGLIPFATGAGFLSFFAIKRIILK